jgi:radical SAM superfamily enzyme YgiQ (UPF0313 family)
VLTDLLAIQHNTRRFALVDSNIYNNRSYLLALCSEIERHKLRFHWGAEATIDIGEDDEALCALRRAGCRILYIGFETLNQRSLNSVHKPYDTAAYLRAAERIRRHGFLIAGYFMVGLDNDTEETFEELFTFIRRARINLPVINILLPAPGTALAKRLDLEGRLLVHTEEEYLKTALFYSSSCSCSFFQPAGMSIQALESGYVGLAQRLSSLRETVQRSLVKDPVAAAFLFSMNFRFRRVSRKMKAAWKAGQADHLIRTEENRLANRF